jgi:hypothetical protein
MPSGAVAASAVPPGIPAGRRQHAELVPSPRPPFHRVVGPKRTLAASRKCERAFTNAYGSQPHARAGDRVECAVVTHLTSAVMTHRTSAVVTHRTSAVVTHLTSARVRRRQRTAYLIQR